MIITGTNHFVSTVHAIKYYRVQQNLTLKEGRKIVDEKLKAGEIHIGPPERKVNEGVFANTEGRYVIESYK